MTTHKHSALVINKINKIKQRVTLFVNPSILKQARAQALVEELTLTSLAEKALVKYLPKVTIIKRG